MSIFQHSENDFFDQAVWENEVMGSVKNMKKRQPAMEAVSFDDDDSEPNADDGNPNQFVLLQLSDGDKRVLSTTEVAPKLTGTSDKPDVAMTLDFEGFKIGSSENVDPKTKATLQLKIGQERKTDGIDKLFYCINGGLDLYDSLKKKRAESKDFKKSTGEALGNRSISLPAGIGMISLQVVKHAEPTWWERVFSFAKTDKGKELLSLIGFGGITETAVNCIGGMLESLFNKEPEVLFQSKPIKLGFSQTAKEELGAGLATSYVSCLNDGLWLMARRSDYHTILDAKPIYFPGFGLLAPDGMQEIEADSNSNPFSKITYAVIRAKMKEVDLKQGLIK